MQEENVHTPIRGDIPIDISLDRNLKNIDIITNKSSDVIIKTAMVGGNRIAALTCEGMASTETLSELVYQKLNNVGNEEHIPPDDLMARIFDVYLIAAEQIEIKNIGDLVLKLQSGFAIILTDGCPRCVAIGVQGYNSRGIDEPSAELNVRGSREGFIEVIRTNMSMIRRRIKSPTLVFEMSTLGDRSNTDICICYISDKVSPKLLENVKRRIKSIKLNTILESGYIQPFFEGKGGWFFSECGTCERPDTFAAKLYEGRIGILVDGTPFALVVPHLFIESFQTLDDYTQKPLVADTEPCGVGADCAFFADGGVPVHTFYVRAAAGGRDTPASPDRSRYRSSGRAGHRRHNRVRGSGRSAHGAYRGAFGTVQLRCADYV